MAIRKRGPDSSGAAVVQADALAQVSLHYAFFESRSLPWPCLIDPTLRAHDDGSAYPLGRRPSRHRDAVRSWSRSPMHNETSLRSAAFNGRFLDGGLHDALLFRAHAVSYEPDSGNAAACRECNFQSILNSSFRAGARFSPHIHAPTTRENDCRSCEQGLLSL